MLKVETMKLANTLNAECERRKGVKNDYRRCGSVGGDSVLDQFEERSWLESNRHIDG